MYVYECPVTGHSDAYVFFLLSFYVPVCFMCSLVSITGSTQLLSFLINMLEQYPQKHVPFLSACKINNSNRSLVVDKYTLENDINVKGFQMYVYECPVTGHSSVYVFFTKFFFLCFC